MNKITTFSTNQQFSTGSFAQKTFAQTGKIGITFFISENQIGAEIEGFSITTIYLKKPKTEKHIRSNHWFVERYVKPCHNANELIELFNIKK